MITTVHPDGWRALQDAVALVLTECGFAVESEKTIETVRGAVEIDVYAQETVKGRRYQILCECKHWSNRVPQGVIHGFRTVVADSGSNVGYLISSAGFQSGAFTAAELTNIRLCTWEEFQLEFEESWFENHFLPTVTERLDPLFTYVEPLLPPAFDALSEKDQDAYMALKARYDGFGWLMFMFTPYSRMLKPKESYRSVLPLRHHLKPGQLAHVPSQVLDAAGYREFLAAVFEYGDGAIAEFRAVLARAAVQQ